MFNFTHLFVNFIYQLNMPLCSYIDQIYNQKYNWYENLQSYSNSEIRHIRAGFATINDFQFNSPLLCEFL